MCTNLSYRGSDRFDNNQPQGKKISLTLISTLGMAIIAFWDLHSTNLVVIWIQREIFSCALWSYNYLPNTAYLDDIFCLMDYSIHFVCGCVSGYSCFWKWLANTLPVGGQVCYVLEQSDYHFTSKHLCRATTEAMNSFTSQHDCALAYVLHHLEGLLG